MAGLKDVKRFLHIISDQEFEEDLKSKNRFLQIIYQSKIQN